MYDGCMTSRRSSSSDSSKSTSPATSIGPESAIGRDQASALLAKTSGRVAWNVSYAVAWASNRSSGYRRRGRSSAGISSAGRNSVGKASAHARAIGSDGSVRYMSTRPENASTVARTDARA